MFLKIKSLFQDRNQKEEKGSGMLKTKIVTVPGQLEEARNTSSQRWLNGRAFIPQTDGHGSWPCQVGIKIAFRDLVAF